MNKITYQVIEDNGGGLHLVVKNKSGKVVYMHSGYEYNPGQLTTDLSALDAGAHPISESWDGNSESPQAEYDDLTSHEYGWKTVATGPALYILPDNMGVAARLEFHVSSD